jgi:hypothetical protein
MLEPVELEFRIKDADLEQGSQRVVNRIVNMDDEAKRLIKRLEVLEAKFRDLASQPAMSGFAEQMADIRTEIDQIGGSLGRMVDGAVTVRIDEVADGMRKVAEAGVSAADAAGNFADGIQEGTMETLEAMRKLRSDLLALGEDNGSSIMQGLDSDIDSLEKKLSEAGSTADGVTDTMKKGFDDVTQSGDMASKMVGTFGRRLTGGLYMIAAQAIAALAVYIYKLATELTDLEKAVQRVDKGFVEFFGNLNRERASVDTLFNTLRNAKEGTQSYETAKEAVINQYGKYLKGLSDEIQSLRDLEGAYKAVSAAIIQMSREKAVEAGTDAAVKAYSDIEGKNLNKIMETFKKTSPDNYKQLIEELKQSIDNGSELSENVRKEIEKFTTVGTVMQSSAGAFSTAGGNQIKVWYNNITEARKVYDEERQRLFDLYATPPDDSEVRKNYEYWTNKLRDLENSRRALESSDADSAEWNRLTAEIEAARKEVEKYSEAKAHLTPGPSPRGEGGREFGREQQRLRQIADLQRRIREQEIGGELEIQAAIIATMEDGIEKELAQISLNYEKRMVEVAKWGDELIKQQQDIERAIWETENPDWQKKEMTFTPKTTAIVQLTPEQQRQISDRNFLAEEEMTKATREALQKRLAEYQGYEIKQREIAKRYTDLRLALDKQYGKDKGAAYQEALENIRRAEQDENDALLANNIEATEAFRKLHKVIEQEGRAAIRERIRRLEEYLRVVADAAGKESELYKRAYQDVKAARKELDTDTAESYRKVADIMRMVSSNMDGAGSGLSKAAADMAQAATSIYQAFQSESKSGQVSGIVSGILSITAAFRDWRYEYIGSYDPIAENAKIYEQIADSVEVTNIRLQRQKLLLDDMVGLDLMQGKFDLIDAYRKKEEDAFNKLNDLNIKYIESQKEIYKDSGNKFFRILGGFFHPAAAIANLINGSKPLEVNGANQVGNMLVTGGQMKTEIVYEFKSINTEGLKDIEDYRDLLLEIKENGGMFNGKEVLQADLDALQLFIDEYDEAVAEIKSIMKELEQAFTNTTADAISQSIADGFFAGKRSMEDFADDFETLMKNAVKASFRINVTDMLAKDFYQKFVEATQSDFMLTAEEIAALKDDFQQRLEAASDQWKIFEEILKQAGIDIADAAGQKREVGGFQTLSQETGTLLLGQFTAFRIHAGNIDDKISNLFLDYSVVTGHLTAIAQNTAKTVDELKGWRSDFKRTRDEGLKVV